MNKTPQSEASIEVVPYDPQWPSKFVAEQASLQSVLVSWLAGPIEHVGSTAIPGMPAKPVIDIVAAVTSLEASRPVINALAKAGIGVGVGLVVAIALAAGLKTHLFGIGSADPLTLAAMGIMVLAITLVTCWIPARRATRIDPLQRCAMSEGRSNPHHLESPIKDPLATNY